MDYWEDDGSEDGYVLVNQEDVVDGITSFMAAYLLSLKQTKVIISLFDWIIMLLCESLSETSILCRNCLLINFRKVTLLSVLVN